MAKKEFGGVDVCISNAGLGHNAPLLSGSIEDWRDMLEVSVCNLINMYIELEWNLCLQVNVLGLCVCNREFMTQLKERGVDEGHIFNINRYIVYLQHLHTSQLLMFVVRLDTALHRLQAVPSVLTSTLPPSMQSLP